MALLDFEGYDRETNISLSNWFTVGPGSGNIISADLAGAYGYGRYFNNPNFCGRTLPSNEQVIWMQGHVYQFGVPAATSFIFLLRDGATVQCAFSMDNLMRAQLYVGLSLVATSSAAVFAQNAWYFVQLRARIANSGGTLDLYVNGALVLSYSGDTQNTANAYANAWDVGTDNNATRVDNIVLYNESGNAPNSRTPETRIYAELPTGAGAATGFTPSAGSNYQCVDEQPNDGDTTFVSAAASPTDDLYAYPASQVPSGAIVYAVALEVVARKDDAGGNDLKALIRSGGTTFAGSSTWGLTTTYQRFKQTWDLDPNTGAAWTVANANAAEIGQRRNA